MRKVLYIYIIIGLTVAGMLCSCSKTVEATTLVIQDSLRHYYPLVQGQELEIQWRVANTGDTPLVFTDIQPSCGCISAGNEDTNVILPHKEGKLKFKFDSSKNTGYVRHTIRLFGNINKTGMAELTFDVNIVPPYNGSPDYEDYYEKSLKEKLSDATLNIKDHQNLYWTDEDTGSPYSASSRYPWKEEENTDEH